MCINTCDFKKVPLSLSLSHVFKGSFRKKLNFIKNYDRKIASIILSKLHARKLCVFDCKKSRNLYAFRKKTFSRVYGCEASKINRPFSKFRYIPQFFLMSTVRNHTPNNYPHSKTYTIKSEKTRFF